MKERKREKEPVIWSVPSEGPFSAVHCSLRVYKGVCTREFFPPSLFLAEGEEVTLSSFRRASLWRLNQSKFPLCFLLWRDLLLLNAGPPVRASQAVGCGLRAKPLQITLNLFRDRCCLSSPEIHPNLLGSTSVFISLYYHSDVFFLNAHSLKA